MREQFKEKTKNYRSSKLKMAKLKFIIPIDLELELDTARRIAMAVLDLSLAFIQLPCF